LGGGAQLQGEERSARCWQGFSPQQRRPVAGDSGSGHKGEVLLRDKVESTTDPDARIYKKATADKAVLSYQDHALTENRNGLVVAAETMQAATIAERAAALRMLDRTVASGEAARTGSGGLVLPTDRYNLQLGAYAETEHN
jgi:hypothetical protein